MAIIIASIWIVLTSCTPFTRLRVSITHTPLLRCCTQALTLSNGLLIRSPGTLSPGKVTSESWSTPRSTLSTVHCGQERELSVMTLPTGGKEDIPVFTATSYLCAITRQKPTRTEFVRALNVAFF